MKKTISIFAVLLCMASVSFGQEGKNAFKLGFCHHFSDMIGNRDETFITNKSLTLEWDRMIVKNLELGLYIGVRQYEYDKSRPDSRWSNIPESTTLSFAVLYGLNANYHFLPLIVEQPTRWDAYLLGKVGASTADKTRFEYHLGLGAGYRLNHHWGIFAEVDYGNSFLLNMFGTENDGHFHLRGGIGFSF